MMGRLIAITILLASYLALTTAQATSPLPTILRCQNDAGTLLPSATRCTDDIGSCALIFGTAATPGGTTRPALCDNLDLADVTLQCARTCGTCCEKAEYDCDDAPTSPINCTINRRYCDNANWTTVMTQYCPSTCNAGTGCRDLISGCSNMAPLCENVNFYTYMQTNCRRSCGLCNSINTTTSTSCVNVASNCAANAALCNNAAYYSLMTEKCASTCGRCGASTGVTTSTCANTNSNCATWVANGFCNSTFYTTAQKRQFCGQSCGLC